MNRQIFPVAFLSHLAIIKIDELAKLVRLPANLLVGPEGFEPPTQGL